MPRRARRTVVEGPQATGRAALDACGLMRTAVFVMRPSSRRLLAIALQVSTVAILASVVCASDGSSDAPPQKSEWVAAPQERYPCPAWAHTHMVWLGRLQENQDDSSSLVRDYLSYNISVGGLNLDSAWQSDGNWGSFEFDGGRFPRPAELADEMHGLGVRVILWIVSLVSDAAENYEQMVKDGYFLKNAIGRTGKIDWWHGRGSLLDYTNPEALAYWHGLMRKPLSMGFDGWKVDGTDPLIFELGIARGRAGVIGMREYSDLYYGDFFDFSRSNATIAPGEDATSADERLIVSRPVDAMGIIARKFSPRRVVCSGWVGDQDPTFEGLREALRRYFLSAWAGYVNFGSDIGGYRGFPAERNHANPPPLGRTRELFIRWAQLGAMSPLMENGGTYHVHTKRRTHARTRARGPMLSVAGAAKTKELCSVVRLHTPWCRSGDNEHRPWKFDEQIANDATYLSWCRSGSPEACSTVSIYRNFVNIHHMLMPYMIATSHQAFKTDGASAIIPLMKHATAFEKLIDQFHIESYCYTLGSDILVCPMVEEAPAHTQIWTPRGHDEWVYWFDERVILPGGLGSDADAIAMDVPMDEFPIFRRKGAVIPMTVRESVQFESVRAIDRSQMREDATKAASAAELRLLMDWPRCTAPEYGEERGVVCSGGLTNPVPVLEGMAPDGLAVSWTLSEPDGTIVVSISPTTHPSVSVELRGVQVPSTVEACRYHLVGVDGDGGEPIDVSLSRQGDGPASVLVRLPGAPLSGAKISVRCL